MCGLKKAVRLPTVALLGIGLREEREGKEKMPGFAINTHTHTYHGIFVAS